MTTLSKSALFLTSTTLFTLSGCAYYSDQVRPPTRQEIDEARELIMPSKTVLRDGVFHMQEVQTGSTVLVEDYIPLKKPNLPAFDVAYISRDVESVILELANAAGESVVIPAGLRGRTITLVHSGANFTEMMNLVLSKAGYHYNYVDGVFHVTRYPIRNYVLEVSQSQRGGSLTSRAELSPELSGATSAATGAELDTSYTDNLWVQVRETLGEMIDVGSSKTTTNTTASRGVTGSGQIISGDQAAQLDILPPPTLDDSAASDDALFDAFITGSAPRTVNITPPNSTDHLQSEDKAEPWIKVTESAGLISVRAAPEAHRQIEKYLEQVQDAAHRQVVVDVRIVALIRDKTSDRGADLNVNSAPGSLLSTIGFNAANQVTQAGLSGGFFTLTNANSDFNFIMQSLSTLGDVYTISTPSMIARNNQISRISVTRQLGFAETEVEQNTTSNGDVVIGSRQDRARFKNSGTVMSALPFIGKSKVQMRFRLSVASQSGETTISTTVGNNDTVTNVVPELANNVIDQDMVLEYGRVYAIGGLVETSTNIQESYNPTLREIPGLREIFQRANNSQQDTEFLVLVKVSRA